MRYNFKLYEFSNQRCNVLKLIYIPNTINTENISNRQKYFNSRPVWKLMKTSANDNSNSLI